MTIMLLKLLSPLAFREIRHNSFDAKMLFLEGTSTFKQKTEIVNLIREL